jgi:hypothetical protein
MNRRVRNVDEWIQSGEEGERGKDKGMFVIMVGVYFLLGGQNSSARNLAVASRYQRRYEPDHGTNNFGRQQQQYDEA